MENVGNYILHFETIILFSHSLGRPGTEVDVTLPNKSDSRAIRKMRE